MTEGQKPDDKAEIEGILADLEEILSEKPPEEKSKAGPDLGIAGIIAGLGEALKPGVPPAAAPPAHAPPAQARPPVPAVPPAPRPAKPPLEFKLDVPAQPAKPVPSGAPASAVPPKPAAPPPAVPPVAKPAQPPPAAAVPPTPKTAVPPAAAAPAAAVPPAADAVLVQDIPADVPRDQIRRVAFLYATGQRTPFADFIRLVDSLALQFSKKPLYLRKVYLAEVFAENDFQAIAEKIKTTGAVGVVGVLPGIPEGSVRAMEAGLSAAGISYYWLTPEEAFKRPVVLGLVVELMLLNSE